MLITARESGSKKSDNKWIAIVALLFISAFVRVWNTFDYPTYYGDEGVTIPAAVSYGTYGSPADFAWAQPQFYSLLVYGSMGLFGDNPYGWRVCNVLCGVGSVLVLYLIGLRLYPETAIAFLSAFLLALDPFHALLSRTAYMEVPVTFFFLLYLYFMLVSNKSKKSPFLLTMAGTAAGLTIATKGYFAFAIPMVVVYSFYLAWQQGFRLRDLARDYLIALILLPIAIYLLSYEHYFARGFDLFELIRMRFDAVWLQTTIKENSYVNSEILRLGGKSWEWFVKPLIFGWQLNSQGGTWGRFLLEINNPFVRILTIPAMLLTLYYSRRRRKETYFYAPVLFISIYAFMLLLNRPMFSYSATVLLPFAYLIVAHAFEIIAEWSGRTEIVRSAFLCVVAGWGIYLLPLYSAASVPIYLYRPVLSVARIVGATP